MKLIVTLSFLVFSLFILGCASSRGGDTASTEAPAVVNTSSKDTTTSTTTTTTTSTATGKTAYEGSTGSGLLMERYKSGEIKGLRE